MDDINSKDTRIPDRLVIFLLIITANNGHSQR